ncbi:mitochondrial enolase superfamily member 1 [Grus japonensis]|uniref:Mitochondrial enolase superfamily member 1 n=1 Tax=Grus japonensis TaxID=30415 RepID=A0ABC9VZ36_GRUJA
MTVIRRVLKDGKKVYVCHFCLQEGPEERSRELYPGQLVLKKLVDQVILEPISKYMKDKEVIGSSQNGFMVGKSWFSNLTAFFNELTSLMDKKRALDVVHLDFSNVYDTVSNTILIVKLAKYGLVLMDSELAEWLGPESCHQWHKDQLETGH